MGYFSIFAGKYINRYGTIQHKDAATHYWGEKWRTPTKEDFEELITKCKWEKYIISTTNQFALKAIGPNGNSIVFPAVGKHIWGHIQMWNGKQWVSDFKQKNMILAKAYHKTDWKIYRHKNDF